MIIFLKLQSLNSLSYDEEKIADDVENLSRVKYDVAFAYVVVDVHESEANVREVIEDRELLCLDFPRLEIVC